MREGRLRPRSGLPRLGSVRPQPTLAHGTLHLIPSKRFTFAHGIHVYPLGFHTLCTVAKDLFTFAPAQNGSGPLHSGVGSGLMTQNSRARLP